jgi:uncharacterized protein
MEKFKLRFLPTIIVWFCLSGLYSQNYPARPEPAIYVNDLANIFRDDQRSELEQMLIEYFDSTSTQIVVVTIPSLEGMDAAQYAVELGEKWGIGQAEKDNGVLFLVAPNDRKMYIATGRGTEEKLTDVFLGRIRDNYILPEFKTGNFYSGVRLGILQMMNRLNGTFVSDKTASSDEEISLFGIILILLIILFIAWLLGKASKSVNYGETYSGRGYNGGGFWGTGGSWGGSGSSWGGGSSGGSFGGGSFGGGGAGGSW